MQCQQRSTSASEHLQKVVSWDTFYQQQRGLYNEGARFEVCLGDSAAYH